jgi:predicted Fe-Mo cluster-binding NifX family protein
MLGNKLPVFNRNTELHLNSPVQEKMVKYKFALASSDGIQLTSKHFGDSEIFVIGEIDETGTVKLLEQMKNNFKDVDESTAHGSKEKRNSIISYLGEGIDFIIAGQMSPNFKQINMKTSVCPVVSQIRDIKHVLNFLGSNFHLLREKHAAKSENRETEILKIGLQPDR